MRRLVGALFTAITVAVAVMLLAVIAKSFLRPSDITSDAVDSLPAISAKQPSSAPWTGTLDNSGYDVSYPQCGQTLSTAYVGFAIVGLNYGRPFTQNPCFADQWHWAQTHDAVAVYVNISDPGSGTAIDRGTKIVADLLQRLPRSGVAAGTPVWLDIERANSWSSSQRSVEVIQTVVHGLTRAGYPAGIYAAPTHWLLITFNARVKIPVWLALGYYSVKADGVAAAKRACGEVTFGDRSPSIVQFVADAQSVRTDRNIMCSNPAGLVVRP